MKTGTVLMLATAMTLALTACGGDAPDAGAEGPATASRTAAQPGDDSVAAVLVSQGTAPAKLRFVVGAAPEPGVAFPLTLSVTAAQPVQELQLQLESAAMTISPASAVVSIEKAEEVATHDFMATPSAAGLAQISVRMRVGEGPESRYAIPVLVGSPAAAPGEASDKADPAPGGHNPDP